MNAINAVQLFIAVWTISVCQADDDGFSVSCDDVTGSVGRKATLTCRVSLQHTDCCVKMYKFQYHENYKDSTICREELNNPCDQRNSFTCSFTPPEAMTERFRFFLQTMCGIKTTKFTVNITEPIETETLSEVIPPEKSEHGVSETFEEKKTRGRGFEIAVIAAAVSALVIIIVPTIYRITQKRPIRKRTILVFGHDGDDCNQPENVI